MNYEHIQQRDGQWCVVDILGKKGRVRTGADAGLNQDGIDHWTAAAGIGVGLTKGDAITGDRLSAQGILRVAVRYGRVIAPHDLRRTFANLAYRGGAKLDQIQLSPGHASIQTIERYLGVRQDLTDAPCVDLHLRVE